MRHSEIYGAIIFSIFATFNVKYFRCICEMVNTHTHNIRIYFSPVHCSARTLWMAMFCACSDDFPPVVVVFDAIAIRNDFPHIDTILLLALSFACIHLQCHCLLALLHPFEAWFEDERITCCVYLLCEMDLWFMLLPSNHCTKFKRAPYQSEMVAHFDM